MTIVWDSTREQWCVMEDEVEIGRFPSLHEAEVWVIGESMRREALASGVAWAVLEDEP